MYKAEELINLETKPRINDISLKIIKDFYFMYLMPFFYNYVVKDFVGEKRFELRFDSERLCHLLGVESIAKGQVKYKDLCQYRGDRGWNNIENGVLDFKHLKNLNKRQFNNVKAKFVYFYLIPNLIEKPLAVYFDGSKVNPPVRIQSEILFYSTYENAVIHLGIDKADDEDYYYPRTFFVEKLGEKNVEDIYTKNQIEIEVKKLSRTIIM